MENFNFDALESVDKANTKVGTPRGQNFKARYRKYHSEKGKKEAIESKFYISNGLFAEMGLEEKGLKQLNQKDGSGKITNVFLAVVENDEAVILRKTEKGAKGKSFKSTILENDLVAAGILEADVIAKSQRLSFELRGTNGKGQSIYEIVRDTPFISDDSEDDNTNDSALATSEAPATVASSDDEF